MFQYGVVDVLFMIVSVILIILVALQSSKQGLSDSLSGGNSELFKNQNKTNQKIKTKQNKIK